jgi:hypothetical protein
MGKGDGDGSRREGAISVTETRERTSVGGARDWGESPRREKKETAKLP